MSTTDPDPVARTCAICGETDTEPHHVHYIIQMGQEQSESAHITCCAEAGCPVCQQTLKKV